MFLFFLIASVFQKPILTIIKSLIGLDKDFKEGKSEDVDLYETINRKQMLQMIEEEKENRGGCKGEKAANPYSKVFDDVYEEWQNRL